MNITLTNDFHNSEARVRVPQIPAVLTPSQTRRAHHKLCGLSNCKCGGIRGKQYHDGRELMLEWEPDIFGDPVLAVSYRWSEEGGQQ